MYRIVADQLIEPFSFLCIINPFAVSCAPLSNGHGRCCVFDKTSYTVTLLALPSTHMRLVKLTMILYNWLCQAHTLGNTLLVPLLLTHDPSSLLIAHYHLHQLARQRGFIEERHGLIPCPRTHKVFLVRPEHYRIVHLFHDIPSRAQRARYLHTRTSVGAPSVFKTSPQEDLASI